MQGSISYLFQAHTEKTFLIFVNQNILVNHFSIDLEPNESPPPPKGKSAEMTRLNPLISSNVWTLYARVIKPCTLSLRKFHSNLKYYTQFKNKYRILIKKTSYLNYTFSSDNFPDFSRLLSPLMSANVYMPALPGNCVFEWLSTLEYWKMFLPDI